VRVCGFACACGVRVRWSARAASSPVALVWPFPGFLAVAPCMPSAFWGLFLGPRWPMCGSASLRAWVSFGSVWGGYSWSLFGASFGRPSGPFDLRSFFVVCVCGVGRSGGLKKGLGSGYGGLPLFEGGTAQEVRERLLE